MTPARCPYPSSSSVYGVCQELCVLLSTHRGSGCTAEYLTRIAVRNEAAKREYFPVRWGEDEVTYEDVKDQKINTMGAGYQKLYGACTLAQQCGYQWIWADTCCIDKSSSAELSEAINSMFVFYSQADLCIAYLVDVPANCQAWQERMYHFYRSEWFTRGWTLQELLAPKYLNFYDGGFNYIGSKIELCPQVSDRTGIAPKYLDGRKRFNDASIAARMSWASKRETTRKEDEAYCLLGIFGVSMPPCYGEGAEAFYRLQCEILARSDDESIFAWVSPTAKDEQPFGLLAESPRDFMHSESVQRIVLPANRRRPVSLTGRGIAFHHGIPELKHIEREGKVTLACDRRSPKGGGRRKIAIYLREMTEGWFRVRCNRFRYTSEAFHSSHFQIFYIPQPNLTTTPRFQEDWRDVGALIRRRTAQQKEQTRAEEKGYRGKWERRQNGVASAAVVVGAILGVHALGKAWDKMEGKESYEDSNSILRHNQPDRRSTASSIYDWKSTSK